MSLGVGFVRRGDRAEASRYPSVFLEQREGTRRVGASSEAKVDRVEYVVTLTRKSGVELETMDVRCPLQVPGSRC